MSFVHFTPFRAEITKNALMDFIAKTPSNLYLLVIINGGNQVYGVFTDDSTVEYLLNEFAVTNFEVVSIELIKLTLGNPNVKLVGNLALQDV